MIPNRRSQPHRPGEHRQNYNDQGQTCYNCQKHGHISRDCTVARRPQHPRGRGQGAAGSGIRRQDFIDAQPRQPPPQRERNEKNENSPRKFPVFGFKRLHSFWTTEDAETVILGIGRNLEEWDELMRTFPSMKDELFVLILHILGEKVCSDSMVLRSLQVQIVTRTLGDAFIDKLLDKFGRMMCGTGSESRSNQNSNPFPVDQSLERILSTLHKIFTFVTLRLPVTGRDYVKKILPGALGVISTCLFRVHSTKDEENLKAAQTEYLQLLQNIEALEKKENEVERRRFNKYEFTPNEENRLHEMSPPDDFRDIPVIPTVEEILSTDEPFLRTNKKTGAYLDANHYLDVQFRLLREDFVSPLKKGIQDFMKHKLDYLSKKKKVPMGNVRIYPEVTICDAQLVRDVFTFSVQLQESCYKRVRWDKSKRLLQGSLLVLTPDNFVTAFFAVVAGRDTEQLKKGIFGIAWQGARPDLTREKFLLVECEVYFEAYRHTLQILKEIQLETFPLSKFIVNASDQVGPPRYLETTPYLMTLPYHRTISPLAGPWPTHTELKLDETQFEAFKGALTKEFAIIQGPPGTGKTFLGLKIAEVFLTNLELWRDSNRGPILVVCYTNHALDQFLEGIINVLRRLDPSNSEDPAVIRVGGRSKSAALDEFSLARCRIVAGRMNLYDRDFRASRAEAMNTVRLIESDRAEVMSEVVGLGNIEGILTLEHLFVSKLLSNTIPESILGAIRNPHWLGLSSELFENRNFSAETLLSQWFTIRATEEDPKPYLPHVRRNAQAKPVPVANGEEDDDDDEDYDLEELLANRIVDDVYQFETEKLEKNGGGIRSGKRLDYISMCSVGQCADALVEKRRAFEEIQKNPKSKPADIRLESERLAKATTTLQNRRSFLEVLFAAYKGDRLQLPSVGPFLTGHPDDGAPLPLNYLNLSQKWAIYFAVVARARVLALDESKKIDELLIEANKKLDSIRRVGDGRLLERTKVVGMTTTGAAKNRDLLQMMKSKIVIVEEAAEVLESHIVTCITEYCQHLILIGDHQQLRPSTTVYELSTRYNLDISLFERMLNNNLNCYKLKVQHRMRPEICNLIKGTIYKELENHESVSHYPIVKGLNKNLFFIDHDKHESSESDSLSKSNEYEAKLMSHFCRHLVLQGYKPEQITILTTYTGQMFLLKKEINGLQSCKGVRVTVVDNFQGEENDIILLSLVRSNEQNNIGFLKTDNRICVAISRAKHGLYVCGNMGNLASKSKTWQQIREKLFERGEIGEKIQLVCQVHETVTEIASGHEFRQRAPEGGCALMCDTPLTCGHICQSVCHINDREHILYKCHERCCKICPNNHQCKDQCYVKGCPPCPVKMLKTLPCAHEQNLSCHINPAAVRCMVPVEKTKPCGHAEIMACYVNPKDVVCKVKVTKTLACSHEKLEVECHVDAATITCKVDVVKTLIPCGHPQEAKCHQHAEMIKCVTDVEKEFKDCKHKITIKCKDLANTKLFCKEACKGRLPCGHACTKSCHVNEDPDHLDLECKKPCGRECANGHSCATKHLCHLKCPPCKVAMLKTLSCDVHRKSMPCFADQSTVVCESLCTKRLPGCLHKCSKKCFEPCAPCLTLVQKRSPCGHPQATKCSEPSSADRCEEHVRPREQAACLHDPVVPCRLKYTIQPADIARYCQHPCGYLFDDKDGGCGHRCKGTCSECQQGRLHTKCREECGKTLVCGHICAFPCAAACPPCGKKCEMKCEHSECTAPCGEPCTGCNEKCNWWCEHKQCTKLCREICDREPCDEPCRKILKCGHECIGFCGEPCPPLCRTCDKTELTEFMLYGCEDEDDARFIYLEDCKHCIERTGLDYYMTHHIEEGEISAKGCPRCKTLIRRNFRYGNVLRNHLKDVMAVKKKVFGNQDNVLQKQNQLINEIKNDPDWIVYVPRMHEFLLAKMLLTHSPITRLRRIDECTMQNLELMASHGRDGMRTLRKAEPVLSPELTYTLKDKYSDLLHSLTTRELPLSTVEVQNFDREFSRLFDVYQLYQRRSSIRFTRGHPVATPLYERARTVVDGIHPYSPKLKAYLHEILAKIDDSLKTGLGISDRERRDILAAFNMRQGRWFKCPNGHIYIITECGGAMEEGRCNECNATIGGGSHRVRADNALASEMDGATHALWPQ